VLAAPSTFAFVTVAFSKLNVVAVEVTVPPLTVKFPVIIAELFTVVVPVVDAILIVLPEVVPILITEAVLVIKLNVDVVVCRLPLLNITFELKVAAEAV
jgi:hypothetical protein